MIEDKKFVIGVAVVTILIFFAGIWFYSKPVSNNDEQGFYTYDQIVRDDIYNAKGPIEAPVVIVEFSDPQCPACRAMEATLEAVLSTYPDDVRLVYRHFPLPIHNQAVNASRSIEASGRQGKFFEMLNAIFENQSNLSDEKYIEIAQRLELDIDKFNQDRASDEIKNIVDLDKRKAVELNLPGTPSVFVNGKLIKFDQNKSGFQVLSEEIDYILSNIKLNDTDDQATTSADIEAE